MEPLLGWSCKSLSSRIRSNTVNQEERTSMQINSQKRGVGLGAVIAMVASLFIGVQPAMASTAVDGANLALTPKAGAVDNFNGTIIEDFALTSYVLPGQSISNFAAGTVKWEVTRVSGAVDIAVDISRSQTAIADNTTVSGATGAVGFNTLSAVIPAYQTTASLIATVTAGDMGATAFTNSATGIVIKALTTSGAVTLSNVTAVVDVKIWVENTSTNNNQHDANEWYTIKRVTLHAVSAVPVSGASITQMAPQDTTITVSATVGALNFDNLSGTYNVLMNSTTTSFGIVGSSAGLATTNSETLSSAVMSSRSGVMSYSFTVTDSATGIQAGVSLSGRAVYMYNSQTWGLGTTFSMVVSNPNVGVVSLNVVSGSNAIQASGTATLRTNTLNTFVIGTSTASASVSRTVLIRFADSDAGLSAGTKEISFNGGTSTAIFPTRSTALSVVTDANTGNASFTLQTAGFVGDETFTMTAYVGNVSSTLTIEVDAATYSLTPVYSTLQSGAGETSVVSWTVTDQWAEKPARSDLRLQVTKGGTGFNYATTVSYVPVVAGVASFNFTPEPAAKTGSATVDAVLEYQSLVSGGYIAYGVEAGQVSVNVSPVANTFGTGLAVSRSISVSYFPSTVSWTAITGNVTNTGSSVVVSGPGLIFRDAAGDTYSNAVTVRAGSGPAYTFDVAGTLVGSYTITLTNGSATTTSLVVVQPVSSSVGTTITFDTTAIDAGKTKIITGTLTDANGNPVDTTGTGGTGSIVVTYTGTAGIPVGSMPTETDADGKFKISILTSAADSGTFTLTATYLKNDALTATADKVTKVQTITVGAAAASSSDQKVNAGSFKGYVAVYAKGYEGQRLSAKIGNDWVVVESLASGFERVTDFTGAGYTIAVRIYIDRVLVDTITVTTK